MRQFFIPRWLKDKGYIPLEISYAKRKIRFLTGYTLVEALFTIAILAMVLVAMTPFIRTVHTSWNLGDRKTELQQNARVGLEMMSRLIRQAKRITAIPVSGSGNFIKFRNALDDQAIIFFHNVSSCPYYIGATGLIKDNDLVYQTISGTGTVNNSLLAKSLVSFTIDFKDNSGAVATLPYNVYSLNVRMVLSDPQGIIADTMNVFSTISLRPQVRITKPLWATSGNNVVDVARDDTISGFSSPSSVSVNNVLLVNGRETVWVADTGGNRIRRLVWTGSAWSYSASGGVTITGFSSPSSVCVNTSELVNGRETVWVADTGGNRIRRLVWTGSTWSYSTSGGAEITGFAGPTSVSVNSNEIVSTRNACWVADGNSNKTYCVKKIYWSGSAYTYYTLSMANKSNPASVSVNTADGTCWVALAGNDKNGGNRVSKINQACSSILFAVTGFSTPQAVSVNPSSGECWVADTGNNSIKKISSAGAVLFTKTGFSGPESVSAVPSEGSCWIADTNNSQVVKLDLEGNEEFRISGFTAPSSVDNE